MNPTPHLQSKVIRQASCFSVAVRIFRVDGRSIADLIVHGILDPAKSIEEIKAELKGIFERLVSLSPPLPIRDTDSTA